MIVMFKGLRKKSYNIQFFKLIVAIVFSFTMLLDKFESM